MNDLKEQDNAIAKKDTGVKEFGFITGIFLSLVAAFVSINIFFGKIAAVKRESTVLLPSGRSDQWFVEVLGWSSFSYEPLFFAIIFSALAIFFGYKQSKVNGNFGYLGASAAIVLGIFISLLFSAYSGPISNSVSLEGIADAIAEQTQVPNDGWSYSTNTNTLTVDLGGTAYDFGLSKINEGTYSEKVAVTFKQ